MTDNKKQLDWLQLHNQILCFQCQIIFCHQASTGRPHGIRPQGVDKEEVEADIGWHRGDQVLWRSPGWRAKVKPEWHQKDSIPLYYFKFALLWMVSYNRSNTQSITAKSQTLNLSMKITNTHHQIMQIYKLYTGKLIENQIQR